MPEVRIGDVNLHYDSCGGGGDPLLMIMGLGSSSASWDPPLIADLARHFQVIVYDNRGTGQSDKPDLPYSLQMFMNDAVGLLDALKLERVHAFGVSMGGMIAQEFALNHGARLKTLTLGCTTAGGKHTVPPPPESMKLLSAPRDGLSDADLIRRSWPLGYTQAYMQSHRDELEASIPRILAHPTPAFAYKRHLEATFTLKTYDRLPQIKTPTLVITGAQDALIPARNAEIIAGRIQGARLHLIADAGHAFFNQARAEFLEVFVPFLQAHPISA